MPICTKCGSKVDLFKKECDYCGALLGKKKQENQIDTVEKDSLKDVKPVVRMSGVEKRKLQEQEVKYVSKKKPTIPVNLQIMIRMLIAATIPMILYILILIFMRIVDQFSQFG